MLSKLTTSHYQRCLCSGSKSSLFSHCRPNISGYSKGGPTSSRNGGPPFEWGLFPYSSRNGGPPFEWGCFPILHAAGGSKGKERYSRRFLESRLDILDHCIHRVH